jgi:hypothetical protein
MELRFELSVLYRRHANFRQTEMRLYNLSCIRRLLTHEQQTGFFFIRLKRITD